MRTKTSPKGVITDALEILGAATIVAGVALIWIPAAFIIGGAMIIGISYLVVRK